MSTLLIKLSAEHASTGTEYHYIVSKDGLRARRKGQASASLLPSMGRVDLITAIIPITQLSWHQITLPPGLKLQSRRHQQRVRAALDGLLEERLLDDPAALHLALDSTAVAGEPCWVAACNKSWLQSHLQLLESLGRAPSRLVPELWPSANPQLLLWGDSRNPQLSAMGLEEQSTLVTLPLKSDASMVEKLLSQLPAEQSLQAEPELTRAAETLQRPVQIFKASHRLMQSNSYEGDLAQFDLQLGGHARMLRRLLDGWQTFAKAPQWRPARWAVSLSIVAQLVGLNAWAFKENQSIALRQEQAKQVLQTTFPHVPVIVDAPVQMQRELDLLRSSSGALSAGDLEALMTVSTAIHSVQNAKGLQYQDKQLRITGLDLNPEAFHDAQQSLEAGGYRLQQEGVDLLLTAKARP